MKFLTHKYLAIIALFSFMIFSSIISMATPITNISKSKTKKNKHKKKREPKIKFDFENENLRDVIEKFARKKGINIVLPQGAGEIKQKVTFSMKRKIPISEAEKYLDSIMSIAGYSMHPNNNFYVVTKTTPIHFAREPLPLYINVHPNKLPKEKRIRAIYYLKNLKVPDSQQSSEPISLILRDIIGSRNGFIFDSKSNGIIATGTSDKIASAMTIILELDNSGEKDVIEVFTVFNASAQAIAKMLKNQVIATTRGRKKKRGGGFYFSPNTIVSHDPRTNSIILMGKASAVTRLREFIREELDKPQDKGKSILHVYDLQYLKATEFAPVLQNIVKQSGGRRQSDKAFGGINRFFDSVIVVAEEEKEAKTKAVKAGRGSESQKRARIGGNRLIIAAKNEDWGRIKKIIAKLDRPDLQAIIDVMIVDVIFDVTKLIQSQTRNPKGIFRDGVEFQSANMAPQLLDTDSGPTSTTLASDLLRLIGGTESLAVKETASPDGDPGSSIISFTDPKGKGIWALLKMLDKSIDKKVIAHPFIITRNGVEGMTRQKAIRRSSGKSEISRSGLTTILQEDFDANIEVRATPRISSLDRLGLQISVKIEDFLDPTNFRRTTRTTQTNANLSSGEILVLGGLTKETDTMAVRKLPFFSRVPVIRNLFRGKSKEKERSHLLIFIHVTIVDPKLRAGLKKHTKSKLNAAYETAHSGLLFEDIKDPITNLFFGRSTREESERMINHFINDTDYTKDNEQLERLANTNKNTEKIRELYTGTENPFKKMMASAAA